MKELTSLQTRNLATLCAVMLANGIKSYSGTLDGQGDEGTSIDAHMEMADGSPATEETLDIEVEVIEPNYGGATGGEKSTTYNLYDALDDLAESIFDSVHSDIFNNDGGQGSVTITAEGKVIVEASDLVTVTENRPDVVFGIDGKETDEDAEVLEESSATAS